MHVAEGGRVPNPLGSPGVIPPYNPTLSLSMTRGIQLMSYDLMAHFSAAVRADRDKWRVMHGSDVAMNNFPQNGFDGGVDHADHVTLYPFIRDPLATLPRYDKMQRTYAGSLITGQLEGRVIWCRPGIDALDAREFHYEPNTAEAAAMLETILAKRWYSYAVAETSAGAFKIRGQWLGPGEFVVYPFILDRPVSFESRFFAAWDETFYPNPLEVYLD